MKKIVLIMLAALAAIPQVVTAKKTAGPDTLSVISFNIRMGEGKDGTNSWQYRCPATIYMLRDKRPDIFGLQEAFDYQVLFIEENMRDYKSVGVGREDGKHEGEHMSIFYNKKTVSLLKWGTFWLSETPEKPSMGWDAACFRTATWALMKDKRSGHKFYYVNTHLDHVGKEAQKKGLALIVERIGEMNPEHLPMVLTGDFNVEGDDPVLADEECPCFRRKDRPAQFLQRMGKEQFGHRLYLLFRIRFMSEIRDDTEKIRRFSFHFGPLSDQGRTYFLMTPAV